MSNEDCRVGKDFNDKTCRYVKECKSGYKRNKDFKCVKDPTADKKSPKRVQKEKVGLLKELFSSNTNNLVKTKKSKLKKSKTILQQFEDFLESNRRFVEGMTWGQTKQFARSKGIKLDSDEQKRMFKDSVVDFVSKHKLNETGNTTAKTAKTKRSKVKKVQFNSTAKSIPKSKKTKAPSPEKSFLSQMESFITGEPSKKVKVFKSKKSSTEPSIFSQMGSFITGEPSKKKASKSKTPRVSKSKESNKSAVSRAEINNKTPKAKTPKTKTPKVLESKEEKERKINEFLNTIGLSVKDLSWDELKEKAREQSILLQTEGHKKLFKRLIDEYVDSYTNMNLKYALTIMGVKDGYDIGDIAQKYKKISKEIFPYMKFPEKKETLEFKRMESAFNFLKERFENNDFHPQSIDIPSNSIINNMNKHTDEMSNGTTFVFYSKSIDKPPGKGAGEKIAPEDEGKYDVLSKIKDWRKKLSNFWIQPFDLEGKRWQSAEHYYQASKFKKSPEFYDLFVLGSGSEISTDPAVAKAAGGKSGKLNGVTIRPKSIVVDDNFFEERSKIEMFKAQYAKFTQNEDLLHLLKLTKSAKLLHYQRGGPLVVFHNLMYIRSKI